MNLNSRQFKKAPLQWIVVMGGERPSVVRLVNMYGDCYIDVPEEFVARTLFLRFLP